MLDLRSIEDCWGGGGITIRITFELLNAQFALLPCVSLYQMDEEKASVEDLLRRGEELLQQTSDEGQREELRLLLLRLQSQYSAHRVRCISCVLCRVFLFPLLEKHGIFLYCVFCCAPMQYTESVFLCLLVSGA